MSFRKITRAVFVMAFATTVSRLFGLFREIFSARFFGTTFVYDAFLTAFMIPNFLRGLLAEGALSTAFIPVLTEYIHDEEKSGQVRKIINVCFTLSLVCTVALSIIVTALSFLAPALIPPASKWHWIFSLLKYTFPYLIFVSLSALAMGVLNTYKHFSMPAYSPVVLDVCWVLALFYLCPLFGNSLDRRIIGLCIGVMAGGLAQFLVQVPALKNRNISLALDFEFTHPAVRKMGRLLAPVVIGTAVGPINLLVDYTLANLLAPGMVSALWYATRIFQLPLGIFAISISTAVLPWFARDAATGRHDELRHKFHSSFTLLFFLLLPFTFGLLIFREELVTLLFMRGRFDAASVQATSFALAFFSLGLIGYGGASVITRAFYAFNDTRTPVKIGIVSIVVNFLLDIVLMKFLRQGGIALSTSIVGLVNFLALLLFFHRRHLEIDLSKIKTSFLKTFLPSLAMGIVIYCLRAAMSPHYSLPIILAAGIMTGLVVYFGLTALTRPFGKKWI